MALTNAERQRRYRERRKAQQPLTKFRRPVDRRSRRQRCLDAARTLLELREEYQEWFDNLPDSLRESAQADKLAAICEADIEYLEPLHPPRGYGRD